MTLKKQNPGCGCCGGECPDAGSDLQIEISGTANLICTDCASYDGTYVLAHTTDSIPTGFCPVSIIGGTTSSVTKWKLTTGIKNSGTSLFSCTAAGSGQLWAQCRVNTDDEKELMVLICNSIGQILDGWIALVDSFPMTLEASDCATRKCIYPDVTVSIV